MGRLLESTWLYRIDFDAYNRGLTKQYEESRIQRKTKAYWIWRSKVLKRDHYKCRECHKTGNNIKLHVHHIDEWFNNQRLRFDVNNGITLCYDCHKKIHPWMK